MGVYAAMTSDAGISIQLEYQDQTLRIKSAAWDNPTSSPIYIKIWEDDILIHQDYYEGQGSRNVPGGYQLSWVYDPDTGMDCLKLPANIKWCFMWTG